MLGHPRVLDGGAIRSLRIGLELTQPQLARRAHTSVRHLVNIERHGAQPSTELLGRLVAALESARGAVLRVDELFIPASVPTMRQDQS